MKVKVAYKQPSNTENPREAIEEGSDTEIIQEYCEYLVASMLCPIQVLIYS